MRVILVLLIFLSLSNSQALEIDEKLTLRFLKVSNSKKTILINRGSEDGLAVGDHAKFFVTSGVIARGVVEKVSPSRSVWSLYRVVDPAEITDAKVLNLKISSPVKITEDPSKSMAEESIPEGTEKMSLDESATSSTPSVNEAEQKELEGMGLEEKPMPVKKVTAPKSSKSKDVSILEETPIHYGTDTSKNWEVWGTLYLNALTGSVENSTAESTETAAASVDLSVGIEKYFLNSDGILKNTSFTFFVHKRSMEPGTVSKDTIEWFEYGLGANYHFYNTAATTNGLIGYGGLNLGKGDVSTSSTANSAVTTIKGTNTFFSVGVGTKYILSNGLGFRALLDYYSSSESYTIDTVTLKRSLSGPRILMGISYRF